MKPSFAFIDHKSAIIAKTVLMLASFDECIRNSIQNIQKNESEIDASSVTRFETKKRFFIKIKVSLFALLINFAIYLHYFYKLACKYILNNDTPNVITSLRFFSLRVTVIILFYYL